MTKRQPFVKLTVPNDLAVVPSGEPLLPIQLMHSFTVVSVKNETIATANVHALDLGMLLLTDVWVHHEHQRKGLGTRLMRAVIEQFGKQEIHLNVHSYAGQPLSNQHLIAWYASFGFHEVNGAPGRMVRRGEGTR